MFLFPTMVLSSQTLSPTYSLHPTAKTPGGGQLLLSLTSSLSFWTLVSKSVK